jgi:hypothetical protein
MGGADYLLLKQLPQSHQLIVVQLVLSGARTTLQLGFLTIGPLHFQAVLIKVAYLRP